MTNGISPPAAVTAADPVNSKAVEVRQNGHMAVSSVQYCKLVNSRAGRAGIDREDEIFLKKLKGETSARLQPKNSSMRRNTPRTRRKDSYN